jgi:DnaK suppressor protein
VKVLGDIESALIQMNTGQYGECQLCEAAISLERLRIVPHTRYCARCHRAEEIGA